MICAWEDVPADCRSDVRTGFAARHVDARVTALGVIPFDSEPVSNILARYASGTRQMCEAEPTHANEAHASHGVASNQLRTEVTGQERSDELRVDPVVD